LDGEGGKGPKVGLAVPAAGSGVRMGGRRKPFLDLAGEPVLQHALRPFLEHPGFTAFAVALAQEDLDSVPAWLKNLDPRLRLVPGGASRGESVWAAIQALPESLDYLAIHDAARPLVDRGTIDRCLADVSREQGAVAGWPAVDTLKQVGENRRVLGTLPREGVWRAQTPQVFPRTMIVEAYESALAEGVLDTDDSALVERMGRKVVMVRGSAANLKVTRPDDVPLAEALLRARAGT